MTAFTPFPKVPRLSRNMVITEKLDGTNASVTIIDVNNNTDPDGLLPPETALMLDDNDEVEFAICAASRKRWITPADDNFGFAKWVRSHANELLKLGTGTHFGEWWGRGIQRGYGLDEKRFSLFNTHRWADTHTAGPVAMPQPLPPHQQWAPACCHVVPVLRVHSFDTKVIDNTMLYLQTDGSSAASGYLNPEGIMVFHTASGQMFKKTFEADATGKEAA